MIKLTKEYSQGQIELLTVYLEGTSNSPASAGERFDWLFEEDVEELAISAYQALETCSGCGWWFPSFDLVDDKDEIVGCEDCR